MMLRFWHAYPPQHNMFQILWPMTSLTVFVLIVKILTKLYFASMQVRLKITNIPADCNHAGMMVKRPTKELAWVSRFEGPFLFTKSIQTWKTEDFIWALKNAFCPKDFTWFTSPSPITKTSMQSFSTTMRSSRTPCILTVTSCPQVHRGTCGSPGSSTFFLSRLSSA